MDILTSWTKSRTTTPAPWIMFQDHPRFSWQMLTALKEHLFSTLLLRYHISFPLTKVLVEDQSWSSAKNLKIMLLSEYIRPSTRRNNSKIITLKRMIKEIISEWLLSKCCLKLTNGAINCCRNPSSLLFRLCSSAIILQFKKTTSSTLVSRFLCSGSKFRWIRYARTIQL